MNEDIIISKLETLPPLPKTIIDIEEFRKQPNKDLAQLLEIVSKDALVVSTLLKVANSAAFSFKSKIETVSKALNLLGMDFTISIAISSSLQDLLKINLSPYGISTNDFMRASSLSSKLAALWLSKVSFALKDELLLPIFLQETGKFILSELIQSNKKADEFSLLLSNSTIEEAEKKITGTTTSLITAAIFRRWRLSDQMINIIEHVDEIDKCPKVYLEKTQILDVLKTICNVITPMSDESIKKGLDKAVQYGLNVSELKKAIEKLQDNLLDE